VSVFEDTPETERGQALFQELLWVHKVIRHDLDVLRRLAGEVLDGLDAEALRAELDALKTNGPLWKLKVNCLRYCRFVHMHHGAEDAMLFPALRRINPALDPIVARLEADHRAVSTLLDDIEAAAVKDLVSQDERLAVADALTELADHLLEHLEFEEREAGPTLRRLDRL
jgi:hypothetical protein